MLTQFQERSGVTVTIGKHWQFTLLVSGLQGFDVHLCEARPPLSPRLGRCLQFPVGFVGSVFSDSCVNGMFFVVIS